ncbi:MAG: TauD/TfdA family dioxygenase [Magnetospirillum sp.]|nr:TauD/TfdA family dioxygenase [Magnetospirillum sp.]
MGDNSMALEFRPLSEAIGTEAVGFDLSEDLTENQFSRIRQEWERHCVILFRGQKIGENAQIRFAERFGPLAKTANAERAAKSNPAIMLISNIREDGKLIGSLPDGEMHFHSDQTYIEKPATGTMLYALEIPSKGGNTLFANALQAYDDLPTHLKAALSGKSAMHSYDTVSTLRPSSANLGPRSFIHPIFRTHPPTGRKALYVNRLLTQYIVGMPRDESDAILNELFAHQEQQSYVYEHVWTVGDLMFWDNRSCLHARTDFDSSERRLLRRLTLLGEKPY